MANTCLRILVIAIGILLGLQIDCAHIQRHRVRHLNVCKECSDLLADTIEPVFNVLRNSTICIERHHGSPPILPETFENMQAIKKKQLVIKLQTFAYELQLLTDAWIKNVGFPLCISPDLKKLFSRLLCLLKAKTRVRGHRDLKRRLRKQLGSSFSATIDTTGNYLKDIYMTLGGFTSTLNM